MEPVRLSFTPTKEDYSNAIRGYNLRSPLTRIVVGFLVVIAFLSTIITLLDTNKEPLQIILTVALVTLTIATSFYVFMLFPNWTAQRVEKNGLLSECSYHFDDDDWIVKGKFGESKMKWDVLNNPIATEKHYLLALKTSPRNVIVIPKRAFTSSEQETAFRAMVAAHLGPIKK